MEVEIMEAVLKEVLRRVKPRGSDAAKLSKVVGELLEMVESTCKKLGVNARAALVGSAARATWLRTEKDIDIFILFPETVSREELERQGLAVARGVAGKKGEERFAEHPYVTIDYKGFQVDLVPAYDVSDPNMIKSAVDRTPHHQAYVKKRLTPELAEQVLLVKQFMQGVGVYGSEYRTRGFSGYLCELLVLYHGSLKGLVEAAAGWALGAVIDIEKFYPSDLEPRTIFTGEVLIVVDPVDPKRNVASAVSLKSLAEFILACQDFVREPKLGFFFPRLVKPIAPGDLKKQLKRRGTRLFCVAFRPPDVVEDVLFPQLRRTERAIRGRMAQSGFQVFRSDVWSEGDLAVILIELAISKLPKAQARLGPPVTLGSEKFIDEHISSKAKLAGPLVDEGGRVFFELERKETDARQSLSRFLAEGIGFGKDVFNAVRRNHQLLEGVEVARLFRNRGFKEFISDYLPRSLPWYR
ncbi:MAG: CCA tRNA nucleotidyltransferase [Candidatus Hadarchaeota archaeon]